MDEQILEGKKTDELEGTSPSGENGVQLNNSPTPTPEDIKTAQELSVDNQKEVNAAESVQQSDAPNETEIVNNEVATSTNENIAPVVEKTFTQSQVNDLVGKTRMETREQTFKTIYGRYGVQDEESMDELVGSAQMYDTLRGEYDAAKKTWEANDLARNNELTQIKEHVALLESGIDKNRFDDAKAIMKAKGLEITVENIKNELATHPEWNGVQASEPNPNFRPNPQGEPHSMTPNPESTIKVLGNQGNSSLSDGMTEEEYALKHIFKI